MPYDDRDDDSLDDLDISLRRHGRGGGRDIPNYLTQAILVTLCCCLPLGIVAIINAAQVNGYLASGNYEAARQSSDEARKWSTIGLALGIAGWIIVVGLRVLVASRPGGRF
jgi:hypothetical protein